MEKILYSMIQAGTAVVLASIMLQLPVQAQDDKEVLQKLAIDVPIADVPMHLYPGLTPEDLLTHMDRNKV